MDTNRLNNLSTVKEKIKWLLNYAALAPSTHNSQPWLFQIKESSCRIFYDPAVTLKAADPNRKFLYISMGCCIENIIVAASYFNVFEDMCYTHLKECEIAEIFFKKTTPSSPDLSYQKLFYAIPERKTFRGMFNSKPISPSITRQLSSFQENNARLFFITSPHIKKTMSGLIKESILKKYSDTEFRKELSQWIIPNYSKKTKGIPGYSLGLSDMMSYIFPFILPWVNASSFIARKNEKTFSSAPVICVLCSKKESPIEWIHTGRLAQRALLTMTSENIKSVISVAAIVEKQKEIQRLLETDTFPQFLFASGYSHSRLFSSPRDAVEKKLIHHD